MRVSAFVRLNRVLVPAAFVILMLPCGAAAQQIGWGVKGGVTLGDVPNFDQLFDVTGATTSQRIGFAAGGFLMVRWTSGIALQPEALYTQKGVKFEVGEGSVSGKVHVKTDFVDVPVLARYTFGKVVRGYVFGGPSFDFKVSAKMKESVLGSSSEEDISSDVKSFEFAIVVGGGVEFGPILLEARWSEGLTNVADYGSGEEGPAIKTRTFLFLGGLRF